MRTRWRSSLAAGAIAWLLASSASAQHDSAGAIEEGRMVYTGVCANCHGPDGDQIRGINFSRGQFRRPFTDAELNQIVRKGIPNTPMPPTDVPEEQAARVVSYLRSMSDGMSKDTVTGDRGRGQAIVDGKGGCRRCHTINGAGARIGPDLSGIGLVRRAREIQQSLVDPAAEVSPENRFFQVVTRDGRTIRGRLLNVDTFTVQLLDAADERPKSFDKAALRDYDFVAPGMPSYKTTLQPQELADVVAYLTSLRRR